MIWKGVVLLALTAFAAASGASATTVPVPKPPTLETQEARIVLVQRKKWRKHRKRYRFRRALKSRHWGSAYKSRALARSSRSDRVLSGRQRRSDAACERGAEIVGGFGFSEVEPTSCSGRLFSYKGIRDGSSYAITLKSANSEISKVKKLKPPKLWSQNID